MVMTKEPRMVCARPRLGAESRTRTGDLFITNELLYQLSYFGDLKEIAEHEATASKQEIADPTGCASPGKALIAPAKLEGFFSFANFFCFFILCLKSCEFAGRVSIGDALCRTGWRAE